MEDVIKCRFCQTLLKNTFVNLGMSPLSNAYVTTDNKSEMFLPLHAYVCHNCFLVQIPVYESPENIFEEYAYFSSYSDSWLRHAKQYADMIIERQGLNNSSFVVEIASNDGYLLQYFINRGINVLGVEPANNVAEIAKSRGIDTITDFFSSRFAKGLLENNPKADLVIANNVLAHVPEINDFVRGIYVILSDDGIATLEFPSVMNLIRQNQFDTIYHEHFSYLSLSVVKRIFESQGLTLFDVEELQTHGGSLRVYACKKENNRTKDSGNVLQILKQENDFGLNDLAVYMNFSENVIRTKREILGTLLSIKNQGKTIVGYGAPAKGNTLLNYCGIREDILDYVVDLNPHKQGKYLPGTHLPILSPEKISETKPDYILILPWNLKDEIMAQLHFVRSWGCKFIIPIPNIEVIN